jgi:hypothetical protein
MVKTDVTELYFELCDAVYEQWKGVTSQAFVYGKSVYDTWILYK